MVFDIPSAVPCCSKVRVKRGDKRAEIRWKLWLREKPKMGRLMEVMLMVGDIVGTVQSET